MRGANVLHTMGFDAFGLPAEQYAVQTGQHPRTTTYAQHRRCSAASCAGWAWATTSGAASRRPTRSTTAGRSGSSCRSSTPGTTAIADKARPIAELIAELDAGARQPGDGHQPVRPAVGASCPQLERRQVIDNHRLAYRAESIVNWCPGLGTVLANEEVTADGRSERGNFPVFRKPLAQWMMRITAYADRLIDDLDLIDWPDKVRTMQRNWIGRSTGAHVALPVAGGRRSRSSPPGRTRCSARPTWCWRRSIRWSTR